MFMQLCLFENRTYSRKSQMSLSSPNDTVVYHFSCARRVPEPDFIKKSTTFSEAGRRSRCVWHMTSASKRSSPIVARTSVNVLVTLLKVRSASAADTGTHHGIANARPQGPVASTTTCPSRSGWWPASTCPTALQPVPQPRLTPGGPNELIRRRCCCVRRLLVCRHNRRDVIHKHHVSFPHDRPRHRPHRTRGSAARQMTEERRGTGGGGGGSVGSGGNGGGSSSQGPQDSTNTSDPPRPSSALWGGGGLGGDTDGGGAGAGEGEERVEESSSLGAARSLRQMVSDDSASSSSLDSSSSATSGASRASERNTRLSLLWTSRLHRLGQDSDGVATDATPNPWEPRPDPAPRPPG
ncbi:uncharacterized protein LOC126993399 [Eriocheir sinensis]|uniref:uncharacterized protein LOC126993399 n=1 Tax=Eriocheir sinensis TaxID=95602 RepID=UPI0021C8F332|nr:uncharacterized protein LOC126993399 [Eriocheir sinensis]